jgi:hypothetical protein
MNAIILEVLGRAAPILQRPKCFIIKCTAIRYWHYFIGFVPLAVVASFAILVLSSNISTCEYNPLTNLLIVTLLLFFITIVVYCSLRTLFKPQLKRFIFNAILTVYAWLNLLDEMYLLRLVFLAPETRLVYITIQAVVISLLPKILSLSVICRACFCTAKMTDNLFCRFAAYNNIFLWQGFLDIYLPYLNYFKIDLLNSAVDVLIST